MTAEPEPPLAITRPYRVRFDEGGPDGLIRTSALLRYAQDVARIHAEGPLGFGPDWYVERGISWVVRYAEVVVGAPIPTGITLAVTTRIAGFRRVMARRRTEVHLPDGSLAMWGYTDFVMIGPRGMPVRVPPEFPGRLAEPPGPFDPGRVGLSTSPQDAWLTRTRVRPQDLDPFAHVNNGVYLDYLEEAVLAADQAGEIAVRAIPRAVRLEYLLPAEPGMRLRSVAWPDVAADGATDWAWRLTSDTGQELARGQLTGRAEDAA